MKQKYANNGISMSDHTMSLFEISSDRKDIPFRRNPKASNWEKFNEFLELAMDNQAFDNFVHLKTYILKE